MKSVVDSNRESRKSLSSSNEETKRNKFEKAKQQSPKIKGNKDVFCWTCHRSGNIATCSRCPRAYHLKCGHLEKIPEPSEKWICPECDAVQRANSQTTNTQVKVLSQMLGYVIQRMKQVKGSECFCEPVDTSKWHDYLEYVVKPMDIPLLENNVRRHAYKSTEAFLADFRWLVHDSYVYNSVHSVYTKIAKSMAAIAKQECEEIKNCADCYLHAYSLGDGWFVEPCTTPHILVWAQLSGFPYWPGKVMKQVSGDMIDVRFFGDHSRANVPVSSCFLYSRLMPCTVKKNHPKIADGIEEAEEHVKKLKSLYGTFYYAQYRVRYVPRDEEVIRKLQLPGLRRPNETPELLKRVELERPEKMILDKDFQSEMKQMYTQKKTLIPAKRNSIDQSPKDSAKRMLIQLNTPMGPKCAIMNLSGSESDSSPKHVSEKLVANTKSSLLNSSIGHQLNPVPSKRMRLSDKIESIVKRTPKKTMELENNEAMVKQVEATSPKELAEIYKKTSPIIPKKTIQDTGIIESISRKLLAPSSHRNVGAEVHQKSEEAPSRPSLAMKRLHDNPKLNGLPKKFKGFSTDCDDESDGDSDALFIASGGSSPVRITDSVNSKKQGSPLASADSVIPSLGCYSVTENTGDSKQSEQVDGIKKKMEPEDLNFVKGSSALRAEEKDANYDDKNDASNNFSLVQILNSSAEKIEENKSECRVRDNGDPSAEKTEDTSGPRNSPDEKAEELSQPAHLSTDNVGEISGSVVQELDSSTEKLGRECRHEISLIESVEEKKCPEHSFAEKVGEIGRLDDSSAGNIEKVVESQICISNQDSSSEKIEEGTKSEVSAVEVGEKNQTSTSENLVSDKLLADGERDCKVSGPRENLNEVVVRSNVEKDGSEVSVVELRFSKANDSGSSVLDLLNGDLTHLYDNLSSQCSSSDESVVNETMNTPPKKDKLDEPTIPKAVSNSSSSSVCISSSVETNEFVLDSTGDVSNENKSRPSVIAIAPSSPKIPIESSSSNGSNNEQSAEVAKEIQINALKECSKKEVEVIKITETMANSKETCSPPNVEGKGLSSSQSKEPEHNVDIPVVESSVLNSTHPVTEPTSEVTSSTNNAPALETKAQSKLMESSNESYLSVDNPDKSVNVDSDRSANESEMSRPKLPCPEDTEENLELRLESPSLSEKSQKVHDPDSTKQYESGVGIDTSEGSVILTSVLSTSPKIGGSGLSDPIGSSSEVTKDVLNPPVKSSPSPVLKPNALKNSEAITSPKTDQLPKSNVDSTDCSDSRQLKDLPQKATSNQHEKVVSPVGEKVDATSVVVQKPLKTLFFTYSNTTNEKTAGKGNKSVNHRSSVSKEASKTVDKCSLKLPLEDIRNGSEQEVLYDKCTETSKAKVIETLTSNVATSSPPKNPSVDFITITSSMSLNQVSTSSARTLPLTLRRSSQNDPAPTRRKATESLGNAPKIQNVKEINKNIVASGMPRPIIIKVEPEEQVDVIPDEPSLTIKQVSDPPKPNIKVVQISNLMKNPPPREINRNCSTPQNNLIPPFNPKRTMADVKALIEGKRQFISAKLKTDIYEMLDEIKKEYDSHIELLTNVSDRYLQQFENTFETDKTKLYEDFKNKLREQMDQQITEIKRKQWCANCGAEASFHCCWNHAYCGDKCQKEDWATHTQVCTQYSMSATDPYVRASPRFQALLDKSNTTGAPRKISLQDLIDVPVAVSLQSSPSKIQIKKSNNKRAISTAPTYSPVIPSISIPDTKLPELPKPPPSAKSFLTAPVKRINNGEQISFDNGAYRIIQNPGTVSSGVQPRLKVVGGTQARNQSGIGGYSGPLVRFSGPGKSFALVVNGDNSPTTAFSPPQGYGTIKKNGGAPPYASGGKLPSKTVTVPKRMSPVASSSIKKSPSVRVMEDNELASILSRNHLRDTYMNS